MTIEQEAVLAWCLFGLAKGGAGRFGLYKSLYIEPKNAVKSNHENRDKHSEGRIHSTR